MNRQELADFWEASSDRDFRVMNSLLRSNHYVWALFLGHLVLEKLLKSCYVRRRGPDFPKIHNLLKLAMDASLPLSEEQKVFLDKVTTFNIRARYPDYKRVFQRKATRAFTEGTISQIKELRQWLKRMNKS